MAVPPPVAGPAMSDDLVTPLVVSAVAAAIVLIGWAVTGFNAFAYLWQAVS